MFIFPSCALFTVVKNKPADEPYVFNTKINVVDDELKKSEKERLEAGLADQIDDSIAARKLDKVLWEVLKNPHPLDTGLISKSEEYMNNYLNGEGYFHDSVSYATYTKNGKDAERIYLQFNVRPGPVTKIDSLTYIFQNDSLQLLANDNSKDALIKPGDPFAQALISSELDRLVDLYRNNGYLHFSRNNLYVLWDTLELQLLQPTLDPFEQATQLQKIAERRDRPKVNLEVRQKQLDDSIVALKKYYVGNVALYPDERPGTSGRAENATTLGNLTVIQPDNKFKPKIFPQYTYLKRGELYKQSRYMRTLNRFNSLGTWRLVDIAPIPRDTLGLDTVDFLIRLTPAPKYNFTTNLEGSFFSQSVLSDNFIGTSINVGLQNRNFLRGANTLNTNIRYGRELGNFFQGDQFLQTQQVSLSNALIFPRFVVPGFNHFKETFRGNAQSVLSLNAANTERKYLFNLTSFNTSWGYDFTWRTQPEKYVLNNKSFTLNIKIPNIEYSYLIKRDSLNTLIDSNPSIKNLFSDGLITSNMVNFSMPWNGVNKKSINVIRMNLEASGLLTGLIHNKFIEDQLYRFIKFDAEYAKLIKLTEKTGLVLRGFGGIGYEFESTPNPDKRDHLPFFKQYFGGGPNSMRAWQLRQLGPGSYVQKFNGSEGIPDRFGDLQLEGNVEYRVPLLNISGIPLNAALFTDVGNVWMLKKESGTPTEVFSLSRLGTDLAIGSGAGIRADFGFFVIRLDYAYKVKDPSPEPNNVSYQNRFFAYPFFKGSQLQVGIGYPFIF